ncbi:MAG: hypothetical protein BJ554DRAFT_6435 [Olpidium bornovanus]|uniref:Peptide hydrolase n=1 Tax=Olpidium bornovanus TaxID=278681 RepID=A0A8H8DMB5_9FUNG|nr:MAG: hypothetical protein BJ554DRAFT_6435 [Olpidium bornovanus]
MFEAGFAGPGTKFAYEDMYGGSDFLPFLNAGVPAGGVLTGAGEIKTGEERTEFGGLANAPLDPCYHLDCDTVENVSREALAMMSTAAAHGVGTLLNVDDLDAFLNGQG